MKAESNQGASAGRIRVTRRAKSAPLQASMSGELLEWYSFHQRRLPWRESRDAYRVWLSEVMLQQTRVAAVMEHYREFLRRFPTLHALAAAPVEDVLAAWSGLGYYRRARALHEAARKAVNELGGQIPQTSAKLRQFPGVGRYTAAAVASIAFGEPVAVADGNVERILSRLGGKPIAGETLWQRAQEMLDDALRENAATQASNSSGKRSPGAKLGMVSNAEPPTAATPGEWNQAMMDLGALICTPRSPECGSCPWHRHCKTHGELPQPPQPARKKKSLCYALVRRGEKIYLRQRPSSARQMPGLWELPVLADGAARESLLRLKHSITETDYSVCVCAAQPTELTPYEGKSLWGKPEELSTLPLTGLAKKILRRLV